MKTMCTKLKRKVKQKISNQKKTSKNLCRRINGAIRTSNNWDPGKTQVSIVWFCLINSND